MKGKKWKVNRKSKSKDKTFHLLPKINSYLNNHDLSKLHSL
jgi:hypothetical protein